MSTPTCQYQKFRIWQITPLLLRSTLRPQDTLKPKIADRRTDFLTDRQPRNVLRCLSRTCLMIGRRCVIQLDRSHDNSQHSQHFTFTTFESINQNQNADWNLNPEVMFKGSVRLFIFASPLLAGVSAVSSGDLRQKYDIRRNALRLHQRSEL